MFLRLCWVVVCVALTPIGCSSETTYDVVPVSGTIKFADGSVPTGEIATVSFHPDALGVPDGTFKAQPSATGDLQKDGSFQLTTFGQPGAVVGHHKVVITIIAKYPGDPSTSPLVISPTYSSAETTSLEAEVTADTSFFELTVEKPNETEIAEHGRVQGEDWGSSTAPSDDNAQ